VEAVSSPARPVGLAPPPQHDDVVGPLLDETRRFCQRELRAHDIDANAKIPREVFHGLAELGLFGITLPEAHGGAGLTLLDACRVVDELARHDRSVAVSVGLHLGLGTRGLVRYGSAQQHERYLQSLALGERIAAFSTTEPGAGSDLSTLRTVALERGDGFVVNGEKSYVTNGAFAGLFTVAVSTPGLGGAQRGQSVLLVEPGDRGFSVQREEHKLGLRGSSTTGLLFEDAALPKERLLGEPGQGAKMLAHILSWGRTLMSAGCCGGAAFALEKTVTHTQQRTQFGRPLAALDVVKEKLARMHARHFAMEALVHETARQQDDEALAVHSLAAKVFCSEGGGYVADEAVQLHGALGFIEDTGVAMVVRDVRVTRIFEGANDVLLTHLGTSELSRRALGNTKQRPGALESALGDFAQVLLSKYRLKVFRTPRLLHALGTATQWVMAARAAAARAAQSGSATHLAMARLIEQEAHGVVARAAAVTVDDTLFTQVLGLASSSQPTGVTS
jgi:alkylation response protein AidB-like acyl-CoA dehydrogenase